MRRGRQITRRDFLKFLWVGFIDFVFLVIGGAGYAFLVEPGLFTVENVRLKLRRLPKAFSGIRIAQLSDIHMGGWMNKARLKEVADLITAQKPDILLITGDFLMGHRFNESSMKHLQGIMDVLAPLAENIPSFAVLGNHDYWTDANAVRAMLSSCNIKELTNAVFPFTRDGESLQLCGVDDIWEGNVRLDDLIDQLPEDGAAILLAHEPDFADTSAPTGKFDLQVSGHSHGGQVVLPFLGAPILPHLGWKYPSGLYRIGEMYLYTNRGVGMGRVPIRLNCPPEITIFHLESID